MSVAIASASLGECGSDPARRSFGEVVSVTADQHSFPHSVSSGASTPDSLASRPAADAYVVWPGGLWIPVVTRNLMLLGPDRFQYEDGQRWIARAIVPPDAPYVGSLRGGRNVSAANAFGSCATVRPAAADPVACSQPHNMEVFGTGVDLDGKQAGLGRDSCADLVRAVTGIGDWSAGSSLNPWSMSGAISVLPLPGRAGNRDVSGPGHR